MALTFIPIDLVTPKPSVQKLSTYRFCGVLKANTDVISLTIDDNPFTIEDTDRIIVFLGGVHQQDFVITDKSSISFGESVGVDLGYEILITKGFASNEVHNINNSGVSDTDE